uniref:AcidPPc domain-containing protein n=1 Tax=Parastrongyloides trichosuri TaxID=131310 RepID=A0A0N4ZEC1_PARTI
MRRQLKANAERDAFLYGTPLPRVVGEVHNPFSNIYSLYGGGNPFASSIGGAGGGSSGGAGGGGTSNVGSVLSMNGRTFSKLWNVIGRADHCRWERGLEYLEKEHECSIWRIDKLGRSTRKRGNGYNVANVVLGGLGMSAGLVEQSLRYGVKSAPNPFSPFKYKSSADAFSRKAYSVLGKEGQAVLKGAKYGGQVLGGLSIIVTVADGLDNGWKNHHTADMAIGIATTFMMSGPWGWALGAAYYITDAAIQARTGRSITEHLLD